MFSLIERLKAQRQYYHTRAGPSIVKQEHATTNKENICDDKDTVSSMSASDYNEDDEGDNDIECVDVHEFDAQSDLEPAHDSIPFALQASHEHMAHFAAKFRLPPTYYQRNGGREQAKLINVLCHTLRVGAAHDVRATASDDAHISLESYLNQLVCFVNDSFYEHHRLESTGVRCLLLASIYFARKCHIAGQTPNETGFFNSLHREMLPAMLLALKFNEDLFLLNEQWIQASGVSLRTLNRLETQLCGALRFNLFVSPQEYASHRDQLLLWL